MRNMFIKFEFRLSRLGPALVLAALMFLGCGLTPEAKEARYLDSGKKYLAKKDYARAAIEFQNAIRLKRGDAEPYYQISLTYIASGDYRTANAALAKALDLNPKHVNAQLKKAELMAIIGEKPDVEQAETLARGVLAAAPNNADALNAVAIAEWRLGESRNAEMDLVRAANQAPQNLQVSLNLAKVKFIHKDMAGAEEVIKKAVAASPNSAYPVLVLAEFYMAVGKAEAAEPQYRRAVQLDPQNDLALLGLANLYATTNRPDMAEQTYRQISALPEKQYKPLHAMFLFQTGKRDRAIAEFEKLVKDDPSDRTVRTRLVEAYLAVNRLSDAENLLSGALNKNGKDLEALIQRSRIYLSAGKYAEAQKDVAKVLRFQSNSAPAHYVMAKIYQSKGATLNQRQELTEVLRLDPRLLPVRLELAALLIESKAASTALQLMEDKDVPDSQKRLPAAIIQRNWALWALGNMAELRKGIDQGLSQQRLPDLLIQDGLWNLRSGKPAAARAPLEEALKINPSDLRALGALSESYTAQKQPALGLQKVKEYAARQPNSAPVQDFLGMALLAHGEKAQARVAFNQAKAADPKFVKADLSLAQVDALDGAWDSARKRLQNVVSATGDPTALMSLGNLDEVKGDHKAAIQHFRKVVETDSGNAQALNNLAYLVMEYGNNPDDALNYAQKAVELAPERAAYCDTLGWILYRKGVYSSAVKYLERAASDKRNVTWKYHLAMAYAKAGDPARGRTTMEAALKLNPNLPEAKMAREVVSQSR